MLFCSRIDWRCSCTWTVAIFPFVRQITKETLLRNSEKRCCMISVLLSLSLPITDCSSSTIGCYKPCSENLAVAVLVEERKTLAGVCFLFLRSSKQILRVERLNGFWDETHGKCKIKVTLHCIPSFNMWTPRVSNRPSYHCEQKYIMVMWFSSVALEDCS